MDEIIVGVLVGVTASFFAGLLLIWKGNHIVKRLRKFPTNRHIPIFYAAYIRALQRYHYHYMHQAFYMTIIMVLVLVTVSYALFAIIFPLFDLTDQFRNVDSPETQGLLPMLNIDSWARESILGHPLFPWASALVAVLLGLFAYRFYRRIILPELLVPYAHRELERLRECIAKCGTIQQYIEYTDLESEVKSAKDFRNLLLFATGVFGNLESRLVNEILDSVSDTIPTD